MAQPWFRFYHEALDDPKVQNLPPELFKFWVNGMCLACRNDGKIPDLAAVSFAFRMSLEDTEKAFQEMRDRFFYDEKKGKTAPHNWQKRQYKSDSSTTRVKEFRKRKRNVSLPLPETPPDTDTEQSRTDTEQKGKDGEGNAASPPASVLDFGEFGQVKLSRQQFSKLSERLNGAADQYIADLDLYSQTKPAQFKKYKNHYAVILQWHSRDLKEGKTRGQHRSSEQNPNGNQPKIFGAVPLPYTPKQRP